MKKILIFIILISFKLFAMEYIRIPFKINNDGNIFLEITDDSECYRFIFDTGTTQNVLYKTGYEKIKRKYDYDIEESLYEMVIENNPSISETVARKYISEYIEKNGLIFELKNLRLENNTFLSKDFIYNPYAYMRLDDLDFDGIIGLNFFDDLKNLTIDYINNQIIINDTKRIKNTIPLEKFVTNDIYKIEISINNVKQDAIVDTGSMFFFIRPEYQKAKKYSEKELLDMSDINNQIYKSVNSEIEVNLKIGKFSETLIGHFFNNQKYGCTVDGEKFVQKINILGNQVFQNHIIQMDFESMEFRIE